MKRAKSKTRKKWLAVAKKLQAKFNRDPGAATHSQMMKMEKAYNNAYRA
jgi:hypothetical protein